MPVFEEPLDDNGNLSEASMKRIREALEGKFVQACASCGARQFAVADKLYCAPSMGRQSGIDFGNTFPMVMVHCANCGHVVTFAARQLGLYREIGQ